MSAATSQERRQKTIRRLVVISVALGVLALLMFNQAVRGEALALTSVLENLREAHGATATIAITALIILTIIENAEKLHFIWEMGHKLLGYDLESMARHEREFTDLPDDYVRRPAMERLLIDELSPGHKPKLVVFTGEHDSGKTTILNYVIPRQLNRPYHGAIINCRADMQSIDSEIGEADEQQRRRLTKRVLSRVIRHAEVPGDTGETVESMSEAIREHFEREGDQAWLIIIDQVDSPNFPYIETLPALFGKRNTVVVVSNRAKIDERAYTIDIQQDERDERDEHTGHVVTRREIHLQPFTADEAFAMLRQEVKKRGGALASEAAAAIKPRLEGTWPGAIQRLSDIFVNGGGAPAVERALDPAVTSMRRARSINSTIVDELPDALKSFMVGLALLAGDTVGVKTLQALAASGLCAGMPFTSLLSECTLRQYLAPTPATKAMPEDAPTRRYALTKLGRGIATIALRTAPHDSELQAGSALLEHYRGLGKAQAEMEIEADLSNILGMMSWAESISCLPDRDVIRFTRHIREALYRSGQWDLGLSWLNYSERAARRLALARSIGELASTQAQLLLAGGKVGSALAAIDTAQAAFAESLAQTEVDFRLGSGAEDMLRAILDYDALQIRWLTHLRVTTHLTMPSTRHDTAALVALAQSIEDAIAWISDTREGVVANARIAERFAATLKLDRVHLMLLQGDTALREAPRLRIAEQWRTARDLLGEVAETVTSSHTFNAVARRELLAQIERVEATIFRRYAAQTHSLTRLYWYVRASRRLTRSLRTAQGLRIDELLTRFESAELQLAGITLTGHSWTAAWYQSYLRRIVTRLLPRWYRLRAAYQQLLVSNADSAALGAQMLQLSSLNALALVANQLGRLERNPGYLRASREYSRNAESILQRLRMEAPDLALAPAAGRPHGAARPRQTSTVTVSG